MLTQDQHAGEQERGAQGCCETLQAVPEAPPRPVAPVPPIEIPPVTAGATAAAAAAASLAAARRLRVVHRQHILLALKHLLQLLPSILLQAAPQRVQESNILLVGNAIACAISHCLARQCEIHSRPAV